MWRKSTYVLIFEEIEDMLRNPGTMEELHQQMKKLKFETNNEKTKLKQFRGYGIWKKRKTKGNSTHVIFF